MDHPTTKVSSQLKGYSQPAEWQPHSACWLAFPSHRDRWLEDLDSVQAEFVALAKAIAQSEQLEILVLEDTAELAKQLLSDVQARFHLIPFGDIWMRDITPIYIKNTKGERMGR